MADFQTHSNSSRHQPKIRSSLTKIKKNIAIVISASLFIEPLIIPIYPSMSQQEKVFKNQTINNIKGVSMGNHQQKKIEPTKKEIENWQIGSYSKYKFIRSMEEDIKLSKQQSSEHKIINGHIQDSVQKLDEMREKLYNDVPSDIVNIIYDVSTTPFKELDLFAKGACRDNMTALKNNISDASKNKGTVNINFAPGYGWGNDYYINANPKDSQLGIFHKVIIRLKEENQNVKNVDWIEVSKAKFEDGNPLAGSDYPYTHEGKFPSDYENKMYELIKSKIKKTTPNYDWKKISHPGIDPQTSEATMPHQEIRDKYGKTKEWVFNKIRDLIREHPYLLYLSLDFLADTTYYLNKGFNTYIQNIEPGKPVSKHIKESFSNYMKVIEDYFVALDRCLASIDEEISRIMERIKNVFDEKGKFKGFESVYGDSAVTKFLNKYVKEKDIEIKPQNEDDLNRLKIILLKIFLDSTLLRKEEEKSDQPKLYSINNPYFNGIIFKNIERIGADLTKKDADDLLRRKWDSLLLVPRNIMVSEYGKPEYDSEIDLVSGAVHLKCYSFDLESNNYIISKENNLKVVIDPGYVTPLEDIIGISPASPSSDSISVDFSLFSTANLKKLGWKQDNKDPNIWIKGHERLEFSSNGSIINYYPFKKFLFFNIDRSKYVAFGKNVKDGKWDGSYFILYDINPPHERGVSVKARPNMESKYFDTGDKRSQQVYVARKAEPSFPILPLKKESSTTNIPNTNTDAFASVAKNFDINSDILMAIYNNANSLNKAINNAEPSPKISEKKTALVNAARVFTSSIYEQIKNDSNLTNDDKTFLINFKDGKTDDLNAWIDTLKKVDTGNLWKLFQGKAEVESNLRKSVSFETMSISLWKPLNIIKPLSLDSIIFGRMKEKTLGSIHTKFYPLNPDGTYGTPITSENEINKTNISELYGLGANVGSGLNRIGSVEFMVGEKGKLFSTAYQGIGKNIFDSAINALKNDEGLVGVLKTIPPGAGLNWTTYTIGGKKYRHVTIEANVFNSPIISRLLYYGGLQKVYPMVDMDVSLLFNWDKEEGFSWDENQVVRLGTTLDFGRAQINVKKELGGNRTELVSLNWNLSKLLGKEGSYFSMYAVRTPTVGPNYGVSLKIPF